jgi:two-component system, chemotaxis family, protein-glutamate methylesterase/glutaminase
MKRITLFLRSMCPLLANAKTIDFVPAAPPGRGAHAAAAQGTASRGMRLGRYRRCRILDVDAMTASERPTRDVIVIGASAGGFEAVQRLLADLPADLPAALFVVIHTASSDPGLLVKILQSISSMPVLAAAEEERFLRSQVYLAPVDRHLLVGRDHVHVRRGPRENGARPAIDPLFRSAAVSCTTRVIGVVLTGLLDDGTAGLQAIKRCGGLAVVQDPREADYPSMPRSAIRHVAVDHIHSLAEMPELLTKLTRTPRPPPVQVDEGIQMEALIAAQEMRDMDHRARSSPISPITCPECHGAMQEIRDGSFFRYRCHTGHAFTLESLRSLQAEAWERALYSAFRAQQERAIVVRRMADEASKLGDKAHAQKLRERAKSYEEGAELLRRLIAHGNGFETPGEEAKAARGE